MPAATAARPCSGSIRQSVPAAVQATQTDPAPTARPRGAEPTRRVVVRSVCGSTRETVRSPVFATQSEPASANHARGHPPDGDAVDEAETLGVDAQQLVVQFVGHPDGGRRNRDADGGSPERDAPGDTGGAGVDADEGAAHPAEGDGVDSPEPAGAGGERARPAAGVEERLPAAGAGLDAHDLRPGRGPKRAVGERERVHAWAGMDAGEHASGSAVDAVDGSAEVAARIAD